MVSTAKQALVAGTIAGTAILGGAVGATMFGTANAATSPSPTSPATSSAPGAAPQGRWHSNTDPAHEAGESAARQSQEKAADATGVAPQGPGPDADPPAVGGAAGSAGSITG